MADQGKCKKSKSGARKATTAKDGRRRPSSIVAETNRHGERIYSPGKAPVRVVTTPEARKRGAWLAGLFAARQPQYPREELTKTESGRWERRQLPPQSRATRKEFHAS